MKDIHAHQFALWCATLPAEKVVHGQLYVIMDKELVTRIKSILRLRVEENFTLFDRVRNVQLEIVSIKDKSIETIILSTNKNIQYAPTITVLLPVLKKDDLNTAVGDLAAVGVSAIQLVTTAMVQRTWGGEHEHARLERVMIAAAEQSKNFAVPLLYDPIPLLQAVAQHVTVIYGDPTGSAFKSVLNSLPLVLQECALLVGPEADFTISEKDALKKMHSISCSLTPTVLRAHLAIAIMAACVRSWYHKL